MGIRGGFKQWLSWLSCTFYVQSCKVWKTEPNAWSLYNFISKLRLFNTTSIDSWPKVTIIYFHESNVHVTEVQSLLASVSTGSQRMRATLGGSRNQKFDDVGQRLRGPY